jgi:hypothetical protein
MHAVPIQKLTLAVSQVTVTEKSPSTTPCALRYSSWSLLGVGRESNEAAALQDPG